MTSHMLSGSSGGQHSSAASEEPASPDFAAPRPVWLACAPLLVHGERPGVGSPNSRPPTVREMRARTSRARHDSGCFTALPSDHVSTSSRGTTTKRCLQGVGPDGAHVRIVLQLQADGPGQACRRSGDALHPRAALSDSTVRSLATWFSVMVRMRGRPNRIPPPRARQYGSRLRRTDVRTPRLTGEDALGDFRVAAAVQMKAGADPRRWMFRRPYRRALPPRAPEGGVGDPEPLRRRAAHPMLDRRVRSCPLGPPRGGSSGCTTLLDRDLDVTQGSFHHPGNAYRASMPTSSVPWFVMESST